MCIVTWTLGRKAIIVHNQMVEIRISTVAKVESFVN